MAIQAYKHKNNIVTLQFSSNKELTLTKSHPVLTTHGWACLDVEAGRKEHYIDLSELKEEDIVLGENNEQFILNKIIERSDLNDITVYNIDVEPTDTYLANGIIVHNADDKGG